MSSSRKMKPLRIVAMILLILVLALAGAVFAIWHNEIFTVASFKKLADADPDHFDGAVYSMNVSGDYYFDDFLAQGGVSSDSELIQFITGHITKGLIPMSIEEPTIACSSFTAATEKGDRIFGRNYDMTSTNTCLVYTKPGHGRHASVSTADLQFIGIDPAKGVSSFTDRILCLAAPFVPLDGINDAGVSCGIYMTFQGEDQKITATNQQTDRPDLTSTTMLRMVLDYAGSVDEAIEMIRGYDLHDSASTSYHYMIADASGRSAVLEWVAGTDSTDTDGSTRDLVITYNDTDGNSEDWQVVTNFIVADGYYEGEPEESMKGLDRYQSLCQALEEANGILANDEAGMELLSSVGRRGWDNNNPNCLTIHSVLYNLQEKTAIWIGNEHYGEEDRIFHLAI